MPGRGKEPLKSLDRNKSADIKHYKARILNSQFPPCKISVNGLEPVDVDSAGNYADVIPRDTLISHKHILFSLCRGEDPVADVSQSLFSDETQVRLSFLAAGDPLGYAGCMEHHHVGRMSPVLREPAYRAG